MDKKKGKKINFKIIHCSSEDPQYPASSLLQQTADAKGWQNKRFSSYPETIVIQLIEVSIINKIAILSHQSKIATKVQFEIRINQMEEWKRLGRVSLDSNVNTNFQARQLKQVNINDAEAKYIRLILRNNHVNNQNLFNQVGIISISFYGDRREDLPPVQQRINMPKSNNEIDQNTLNLLKQLQNKKKRAVQQQNYDLAKQIKDQIERVKTASSQIALLQERKQEAIRRQNYEDAKTINEQIKRLRSGGQSQPNYHQQTQQSRQNKPSQYRPQQQTRKHSQEDQPMSKNTRVQQQQPQQQQRQQQSKVKTETTKQAENFDQKPIRPKNNKLTYQQELQNFNKQISNEAVQKQTKKSPLKMEKRKTQADKSSRANQDTFDQKPMRANKKPQKSIKENQYQDQLQGGNEFIEIPKKPINKNVNVINQDQICQFCKRVDKRFVEEDYKDMHYFNACPMLTVCNQCGQAIEVSTLTYHLVAECANSKYYKKCPRCKQAVHQKVYKTHMQKKECQSAKPLAANNRCPLCHLDINPGTNGWKQHLVDQGCQNNPRA